MNARALSLALLGLAAIAAGLFATDGGRGVARPDQAAAALAAGLPNGVTITPAGTEVDSSQVHFGLLPQELALSPSGRWLATSEPGNDTKTVSLIDVAANRVVQNLDLKRPSFAGIVFKDDDTLFVSGGTYNGLYVLKRGASGFAISDPPIPTGYFPAQLALDPSRKYLYVANDMSNNLTVIDADRRAVIGTEPAGDHPYGVLATADHLYVSNWGGATVNEYMVAGGGAVVAPSGRTAKVGEHPSALALDAAAGRLYVADGNSDAVSVVDTGTMQEISRIRVAPVLGPKPTSPLSAAPGALVLSGSYLFAADGGNNSLAVVDTRRVQRPDSALLGYIPAGWYPSALRVVGNRLYYANAKGNGPTASSAGGTGVLFQGRGTPPLGTVWSLPVSQAIAQIRGYSAAVAANNRWHTLPGTLSAAGTPLQHIKHVVYVLRENKTFDEEFSDIPGGNGQQCQTKGQTATWHPDTRTYTCPDGKPPLLVYGRQVTPNNHALAQKYALLNDFDVDVETSIIGHQWAHASQLSDFAQRTYGNTEGWTSQEPGFAPQNGVFDIAYPAGGYLFDAVMKSGHTARDYSGGFDAADVSARPSNLQKLVDNTDFLVPIGVDSGLYPDTLRVREFERDVAANGLADFSYIWLPDDHTVGGLPGNLTPQSQVATNDIATGQLVDFLSHRPEWKDTAVFVIEDDPQSGSDHVSGYRSIFMVASPWAKRGYVSGQHYDMSGLLRTMELVFDVPPMSENDLTIAPMTELFTETPDYSGFTWLTPEVPPTLNPPDGPFAAASRAMDFRRIDSAQGLDALLARMALGDHGVG
ncbi:MAG TPA: bifunctional YncE family protein/alkaline phosphatase family protein, partial [Candidatus Dormibacteraeota bacterium]